MSFKQLGYYHFMSFLTFFWWRFCDFTSLYPWCNKTTRAVVGHPHITKNCDQLYTFFGAVLCTALPSIGTFTLCFPTVLREVAVSAMQDVHGHWPARTLY